MSQFIFAFNSEALPVPSQVRLHPLRQPQVAHAETGSTKIEVGEDNSRSIIKKKTFGIFAMHSFLLVTNYKIYFTQFEHQTIFKTVYCASDTVLISSNVI